MLEILQKREEPQNFTIKGMTTLTTRSGCHAFCLVRIWIIAGSTLLVYQIRSAGKMPIRLQFCRKYCATLPILNLLEEEVELLIDYKSDAQLATTNITFFKVNRSLCPECHPSEF